MIGIACFVLALLAGGAFVVALGRVRNAELKAFELESELGFQRGLAESYERALVVGRDRERKLLSTARELEDISQPRVKDLEKTRQAVRHLEAELERTKMEVQAAQQGAVK